ncbi:serine hydrolase BPHL [Calliopsis andreniformis]|uniref:serine hydrolase BPHL n=1 Tax=Calliopsis andreniformis TaxID=337506 RepID=UPI003FCC8661
MLTKLHSSIGDKLSACLSINWLRIGSSKRRIFTSTVKNQAIEEQKTNMNINYLRTGTGYPVLLLPGAVGSIWTDFKPQIEGLNKSKFTIVAWDPPGYGKSRPPDRIYYDDFLERDAEQAHNLMKTLGYSKFSVIGWSDGGITSLMMAAMFPESITKMVAVAANAYITPKEAEIYKNFREIESWSEKMRAPMIALYGKEYFEKIWTGWVDGILRIYEQRNGDLCKGSLSKIKCPTLIIQGSKDPMVLPEHPIYLKEHIPGAKLKIFEKGAHNLHLRYPEEFNELVTKFLCEENASSL